MKHIFVINPSAGKGSAVKELLPAIIRMADATGMSCETYVTKGKGDAEAFARSRCRDEEPLRFYACGGDGTLNEVANGIYGCENAELAVIPTGTGNDFVKTFKNSRFFSDLERQVRGTPKIIDTAAYNSRICINVCNIGFDSAIANRVEKLKKYPFIHGKAAYIAGIFLEFFKKMGNRLTVIIDDQESFEGEFLLFAAGSGSYYGGGFRALPMASRIDGELDVCLVRKIGRQRMLNLISDYKAGRHLEKTKFKDCVIYRKCRKVTVKSDQTFLLCVDGEITEETRINMTAVPKSITLSLPEGCE